MSDYNERPPADEPGKENKESKLKEIYDFGLELIHEGINPIFFDLTEGKKPIVTKELSTEKDKKGWGKLKEQLLTIDGFNRYWDIAKKYNNLGIGYVNGEISGNLETIDIDRKDPNKTAEEYFKEFCEIEHIKELFNIYNFYVERTQGGGFHIAYRSDGKIEGSRKLAHVKGIKEAIFETRGEGGALVCSPTNKYTKIQGDLLNLPTITTEEREILLLGARSFNDFTTFEEYRSPIFKDSDGNRPGDIYQNLPTTPAEIKDLLTSNGYKYNHRTAQGEFFTRPGKKTGVSCCYDGKTLYNFSTGDPYFNSEKAYNNFQIFTIIKYGGDFIQATKEIAERQEVRELLPVQRKSKKKKEAEEQRITQKYFLDIIETDEGIKYDYSLTRLIDFLQTELKIFRFAINPDEQIKSKVIYDLIQINGKIITRINVSMFKGDLLTPYFEPQELDYIMKKSHLLFNDKNTFEYLSVFKGKFNKNTETKKYIYFKNKFAIVTKNENIGKTEIPVLKSNFEIKEYNELPAYIWEDSKLTRDITEKTGNRSEFWTFLMKIAGLYLDKNLIEEPTKNDILHYFALLTGFAQYLDDYYSPKFKFLVLLDQRQKGDLETKKSKGRTGKTVFEQAIMEIVKETIFIDGKKFDPKENFAWQQVKTTTKVIILDDVKEYFNLTDLYSIYSIGLTVNPKNQPAFSFNRHNNPKFIISTNYTIRTVSESDKARVKEVELAPYYSLNFTPIDDYGHFLFDNWDAEQWNEFYWDCLDILQIYTDYGLIDYELINVIDRKAIQDLGETLYYIVIDYFTKDITNEDFNDLQEDLNGFISIPKDNFYKFYKDKAKEDGNKEIFNKQRLISKINDFLESKEIDFDQKRSGNKKVWKVNKTDFEAKTTPAQETDPLESSELNELPF